MSCSSVRSFSRTRMEPSFSVVPFLGGQSARQLLLGDEAFGNQQIPEAPVDGLPELGLGH